MSTDVKKLLESLAARHPVLEHAPIDQFHLDEVELHHGVRLPLVFAALLRDYSWPAEFILNDVALYPRSRDGLGDWQRAMRADDVLSDALLRKGLVPIGRPLSGSYDPICLATAQRRGKDCPLVRVDHELALMRGDAKIVERRSETTRAWIEAAAGLLD